MKLSQVLKGYRLDKKIDLSPNTINGYELIFKRLVEFLGNVEFEEIESDDLREFLIHAADEHDLSKKSLANIWIALSSLWSWAERELKTPHIIRGKIKRPKFTDKAIEPLSKDEVRRLISACEFGQLYLAKGKPVRNRRPTADRDKAILLVLLDTGIRAQELCDLIIADYDEQRGRFYIKHGKGGKQRFVPLGNRSMKALWRYLAARQNAKSADPLFATQTGNHLDRNNLGNLLEVLAKNAGVVNANPHRWRHTFAITFLRNGGNLLTLQAILGHATLEMVRRYAKLAERDIDEGRKNSPADNWRL